MKTSKFFIAVIITISQTIAGTGGSNYSRYGLGDIQYPRGSFSMGMAGAAISVLSSASANRLNPAGWTIIDRTRFSIDAYYQGFSMKSATGNNFLSGILFEGFDMSVPVAKEYGIVVGAGLHPYSNVDYNILVKESASDYVYDLSYVGEGGLSAVIICLAFSISIGPTFLSMAVRHEISDRPPGELTVKK